MAHLHIQTQNKSKLHEAAKLDQDCLATDHSSLTATLTDTVYIRTEAPAKTLQIRLDFKFRVMVMVRMPEVRVKNLPC